MTVALVLYRLRPLRPGGLVAAWAAVLVLAHSAIPSTPLHAASVDPALVLVGASAALGVGTAFMAGHDVDVSEAVLRAMPTPFWRTVGLRFGTWLGACLTGACILGARAAGAMGEPAMPLVAVGIAHVLFAAALTLGLSRVAGSFVGAGYALAIIAFLVIASWLSTEFPLRILDGPDGARWRFTRTAMYLISAALTIVTFGLLRCGGWWPIYRPNSKPG